MRKENQRKFRLFGIRILISVILHGAAPSQLSYWTNGRWSFDASVIYPVKMKKKWWIREIQMTSSKSSFTISGKRAIPWHIEQVFGNPCNNRQREKRNYISWSVSRFEALCFDCLVLSVLRVTVTFLKPGHLDEDYPITPFEGKRFSLKVFGRRNNNIHKFESCFLRGQVSSNSFKVF